jgi:hypothetical protein
MQALRRRQLPCPSPFAGLGCCGAAEDEFPECVEDITQWGVHKGISPKVFQASGAIHTRYHQFVHCERVIAGRLCPGDGQSAPYCLFAPTGVAMPPRTAGFGNRDRFELNGKIGLHRRQDNSASGMLPVAA